MQRFFVKFPLSIDMDISDSDIVHQLTRVLRAQIGESIVLFSGDGTETEYEINRIDKKTIGLRGKAKRNLDSESKKKVYLYQSLPNKYEKIEYIIQKGVEIGIAGFVFFRSERSQKLLLSDNKIERFHLIAKEALEQCGGDIMPEIQFLNHFPEEISIDTSNIVLDTIGENRRLISYDSLSDMNLWVGPEGGWSELERQKMIDKGFIFARFGERVLRTETAGIVIGFGLMNG
ncbi:16S rRNA (uracil(1498)-N(3))-methyltransferase [Candidatus Gracilibacteria bacterium]|nr:16S rRNA (uracil(1498)-N(3))-methyltransferase [Candidatus Gracilibacteria bacterium]